MGSSNLLPSSASNMLIDVSGDQPDERSSSFFRPIKGMLLKPPVSSFRWALGSASNEIALQEKILEDISILKTGYHKREGRELQKVLDIWREINLLQDKQRETMMCHFSSMLKFFTDNGIQPITLSDHIFPNHCLALLRGVDAYKDLNGVNPYLGRAQILKCSTGEASSSRRTTNIGVAGDGPIGEGSGRSGGGLSDSTIRPLVEDHVAVLIDSLAADSFSLGTTTRRNTSPGHISGNIDMGDGRRRDQEPKMKEFRTFAYVTIPLFITIQVSLLSANKRQPEVLFRSCGSLVTGATICSIGMLVLVLMGPSSQRALIFLKMLQLLIIGLLFVAAILVLDSTDVLQWHLNDGTLKDACTYQLPPIDIKEPSQESARTPEEERRSLRNFLLVFAFTVMGLAFAIPFALL